MKFIETNKASSNSKDKKKVSFIPLEPEWDINEIVCSEDLRTTLSDIIAFCKNKEQIIQDWNLSRFLKGNGGCIGINLWGLPGTGKSIAAEAIAKALGKRIIQASYSSLMDSLQGNTEKNLTSLFDTAVQEDCVILFDEADGLLSSRKTGSANSDSSNLIKSHMLNLLDRSSAIVIFTTNFFKSYDRAFVRRILWNVEFKAPNIEELTALWNFHLGNIPKAITCEKLAEISNELGKKHSINITGGDIRKLTLVFCTRLSAQRINELNEENSTLIIERYIQDLQENNSFNQGQYVKREELPDSINQELDKQSNNK